MNTGRSLCFGVLNSLMLSSMCAAMEPGSLRFRATVLPPLPGGTTATANAINDLGQVAGASTTPGTGYPNAVTWIDGKVIDISGLGVSGAGSTAVNNSGVVVGFSDEIGLNAFSWQAGVLTPLEFPWACCSQALAVNERGQAVGRVSLDGINTPNDAVLWDGEKIVPLGTLGGFLSHPFDINDSMQIVGMSDIQNNGEYFPFIWHNGVMSELPSLGGTWNMANAISDSGIAVGQCSPRVGGSRPVKWINGRVIELPLLGGPFASALDISESGWIVGHGWTTSQPSTTGILWLNDQAMDLNLHTLFEPGSQIYDARGVNELGQIVGEGIFNNAFRGYVLTPMRSGDVNGDDAVNIDDLISVINGWGTCAQPHAVSTCPGDLDLSGSVNIDDLLRVIAEWG